MNPVNSISYSPLTTADISRMPSQAAEAPTMPTAQPDVYVPEKKSSVGKKIFWGAVITAAAIVGLKRFGGSLFKIADPNKMNWLDKIKKPVGDFVNKVGGYIEKPFIASYNWVKGLFNKAPKVADTVTETTQQIIK